MNNNKYKRYFFTLRAKMLIYFGTLFLLMLLTIRLVELYGIPFIFKGEYKWYISHSFNNLSTIADLKKDRLLIWLNERKKDIEVMSNRDIIKSSVNEISALIENSTLADKNENFWIELQKQKAYQILLKYLSQTVSVYGVYNKIQIFDVKTGTIIVSTKSEDVGLNIFDREHISKSINWLEDEVIDIHKDSDGNSHLIVSRVIKTSEQDNEHNRYVVIAHIDIDDMIRPIIQTGIGLGKTGEVVLLTQDCRNIMSLKYPVNGKIIKPLEYQLESHLAKLAATGKDGNVIDKDYRKETVLAVIRYIPITSKFKIGMEVKQDEDEILAPLRNRTIYFTIIFLIGFLVLIGLSFMVADNLSKPIKSLSKVAEQIEQGNLNVNVPIINTRTEIGILSLSFSSMLKKIKNWYDDLERQVEERTAEINRINQLLKESEERYRMMAENINDVIWIINSEGKFTYISPSIKKLRGYTVEEAIKQNLNEVFTPESYKKVMDIAEDILKKVSEGVKQIEPYRCELEQLCKDGSTVWTEDEINVVFDESGNLKCLIGITRNISESKKQQREISKLLTAIKQSPATIVITDVNGNIEYANPKFTEVTGYTIDEAIGKNPRVLKSGAHSDEYYKNLWDTIKSGNEWRGEFLNKKKNGELYWEFASISPVKNEKGEIISFIAVKEDITNKKLAEEKIQKLNESLTQRTIELEAINKELEAFSYSVSHDLRAPIRIIDGFTKILLEDYSDKLDEEGKSHIERIRDSTLRMNQLIDDLLRLSKITRDEMHRENVNLSKIVEEIANDLQNSEPNRNVEFVITPDVFANVDQRLIKILLGNLIGNAWKYTGKQPNPKIEFGITELQNKKVYFVRDNGVGFNMKYAGKLFAPFQRLHSKDEFEGTGIGLAIVQRVINRHGGQIWAESEVGKGSTFYFII